MKSSAEKGGDAVFGGVRWAGGVFLGGLKSSGVLLEVVDEVCGDALVDGFLVLADDAL